MKHFSNTFQTLFITLFLILSTVRCTEDTGFNGLDSKNNLPKSESTDYVLSETIDSYIVSREDAIQMAQNHFLMDADMADRTPKEKNLKKVTTIEDSATNETLIYTLEYENGGFCLVSADNRYYPILAYSEDSPWGGKDLKGPDIFIHIWEKEIQKIKKENKKAANEIEATWNKLKYYSEHRKVSPQDHSIESFAPQCVYGECRPFYCEDPSTHIEVGPLVHPIARWSQGGSFSYYSPSDSGCECDKKSAGCGPIALGMLLRYHESPLMNMTFNGHTAYTDYDNMPLYAGSCSNNSGGYKSSAMLIRL